GGSRLAVAHQSRACPASAVDGEAELATSVRRRHLALELGHLDHDPPGELLAEVLRQVAHGLEVEDGLAIEPHRQLPATIARGAVLDGEILELGREEADEVHGRHDTAE